MTITLRVLIVIFVLLGCIFKKNFDFKRFNNIFTPEIKSIMLASEVLRKNKKEVKNDLLSMMAPPIVQRCSFYDYNLNFF